MKHVINQFIINKVISLFNDNPFKDFTIEHLKPIRQITGLGYGDIKRIILEYNMSKSAQHPTSEGENVR
jgi:hypothetical protein